MTDKIIVWIVTIGTIVIAVAIAVAHFFGVLEPQMHWFKEYSPVLVLLLLGVIATFLNLFSTRLDQLQNSLDSVNLSTRLDRLVDTASYSASQAEFSTRLQQLQNSLDAMGRLEIHQFNSPHDLYQYWSQRLHEAHKRVDDLTWGYYPPHYTSADTTALDAYVNYIPEVCSRKIPYREVMTFPNLERVKRAEQMLMEPNRKIHEYHLRYYDLGNHTNTPPLMQFSVIDSEEVFIFFYREPFSSGSDELRLALRHPTIVKLFQDYFDAIWRVAIPLKQGDDVKEELMKGIRAAVEQFSLPHKP